MSPWINDNGWFDKNAFYNQNFFFKYQDLDMFFYHKGDFMIPVTIKEIENNNGWIKIETIEDLPIDGYYDVIDRKNGRQQRASLNPDFGRRISFNFYSHYKEIVADKPPIF